MLKGGGVQDLRRGPILYKQLDGTEMMKVVNLVIKIISIIYIWGSLTEYQTLCLGLEHCKLTTWI